MLKKLLSLCLCLCSLLFFSMPAFAATTKETGNLQAYQSVLDKLNEEYGTTFHFPTEEELHEVGLTNTVDPRTATVSATEFEKQLRPIAERISQANLEAEREWEEISARAVTGAEEASKKAASVQIPKQLEQTIEGAVAYFSAYAEDSAGYWRWDSFIETYTTMDYDNDEVRFTMDDPDNYSYKYLDAYRTCAVKYTGTLYSNTLVGWIPSDYTQTAEWYAST